MTLIGIALQPGIALAGPPRTISEGMNSPVGVSVAGEEVYVANINGGNVTIYDAGTGVLLRTIGDGLSNLAGVAVAAGEVYVANWSGNSVTVYDAATGDLLRTISDAMNTPAGVAVADGELYVGNDFGNNVTVYEADTGLLLRTIAGDMSTPYGVTVAGEQLYVSNFDTNSVTVYDRVSGALLRTISGGMNNPVGVALADGQIYVANSNNNNVTVYDADTGVWRRTITGRMNLPYGLSLAGGQLYVANWFGNNVTVYSKPSPPTEVSGTAGDNQAAVTWNAPGDDGGTAIVGYEVTAHPGGATCITENHSLCTVDGLTNGLSYEFTVTTINAMGSSDPSVPSAQVTPEGTATQRCVTAPTSIPRRGTKKLMRPGCVTNAGQRVGVKVRSVAPRGDMRSYRLFCVKKSGKKTTTTKAGFGGFRVCKNGRTKIRTYGVPLELRIVWKAKATTGSTAFTQEQTYKT